MGKSAKSVCQVFGCKSRATMFIVCSHHWERVPPLVQGAVRYWAKRPSKKAWKTVQRDAIKYAASKWTDRDDHDDYDERPRRRFHQPRHNQARV